MNYATLDDFLQALPHLVAAKREKMTGRDALFLLETRQGRSVLVQLRDGEVTFPEKSEQEPVSTVVAGEEDLLNLISGKLNPAKALLFGKVKIKGNPKPLMDLVELLK